MQTRFQFLCGYLLIILETLSQRVINRNATLPTLQPPDPSVRTKTAVITGANTGLGLETARHLAATNTSLILACRSPQKAALAASSIRSTHPCAQITTASLDLSSLASVRAFAASFTDTHLDILVLNAGVMSAPHTDPETHFSVNHVAHALLALLLQPCLAAAAAAPGGGRVVVVGSITFRVADLDLSDVGYARRPYRGGTAYANSKLCNLQFARALEKRVRGTGVRVVVVHPGESTTDVARNLGRCWMWLHQNVGRLFLLSPAEASRTSVFAAISDEVAGVGQGKEKCVMMHAVREKMDVEERFVREKDVEELWGVTVKAAGVTDEERHCFCRTGARWEVEKVEDSSVYESKDD